MGWIFDLGDIDMPLPDAPDYSKRIYELLKETDLENLTYSQFQGVAEKLFIEPENEDEMRRLVLVQLARMAVRGDWDGFLTAGGGGGGADYGVGAVMASTDDLYVVGDAPPFGGATSSFSTIGTNYPQCYPFICAKSGNVSTLTVRVNIGAANDLQIGIYADSGSGYPTTQVGGTSTLDCSVNNSIPTASPASTIALVQGTKYWMCYTWASDYTSASPNMAIHTDGMVCGWNQAMNSAVRLTIQVPTSGTANTLPSPMPTADYTAGYNKKVRIGIDYA